VFLPGIPGAKVADYIRERVSRGALSRR
jgi:hypothetical protein